MSHTHTPPAPDEDVTQNTSSDEHTDTSAPDAAPPADTTQPASEGALVDQLRDQLQRKVAEFENYRRRTDEEKSALIRYGHEGLLVQLLPVLDDFDRSMKAGAEFKDFASFYTGIELLRSKFLKVLENKGLAAISAKGQPFDVHLHEAVLQVPSADVEPGTVIDEVETGYTLYDRVIRHTKVIVSAEAPASSDTDA
jgi:molecular chaperone GrpE